jgi:predicted dehydrogenase
VGVVGAGLLGARHARAYAERPGCRLVGVCDLDPGRAAAVASRHGASAFADVGQLLAAGVDAVSVATPDHAHYAPVAACLDAGVDVLVEKPLAVDAAEAAALVAKADAARRVLVVNYSQRWLPEHRRLGALLADGTLGDLVFVESHRWDAAWVPGRMIAAWADRTTPIHFMSSHDIDLILAWTGRRVRQVYARAHRGALPQRGVLDGLDALLTLEGDVTASLHASWLLPATFPAAADTRLELIGSRGGAFLDGNARTLRLFAPDRSETIVFGGPRTADEVDGRLAGAFVESLSAFLAAAAAGDRDTPTSAARTLHVAQVQAAIVRSAQTGRVVEPPESRARAAFRARRP